MLPKILVNAFNLGQSSVTTSTAELNIYAKFMQNLNIPKTTIKFVLEDEKTDEDISFETYFNQFDTSKNENVPKMDLNHLDILGIDLTNVEHIDHFDSTNDFVSALNQYRDKLFKFYSNNVKSKMNSELVEHLYNNFMELYDVKIYRSFKIKKADLLEAITKQTFHSAVLHLYSRILHINIIIINGNSYDICCNYDENKETVIFTLDGEKFTFLSGGIDSMGILQKFESNLVETSKKRNEKIK